MAQLRRAASGTGGSTIMLELADAIASRQPVVLVTVVDTSKSVPRRAGSKMLVYEDGRTSGTIGGGEMEARSTGEALDALKVAKPRRLNYSLIDAAAGDPGICGGDVELFLEPHMPQTTLYVLGVGHVGQAVVELANWMGFRVVAWDDRPEIASLVTEISVFSGDFVEVLEKHPIDEHSRVVLTTRNVGLDVEVLPPLLDSRATFIGTMGSRRRWSTTKEKLLEAGHSAQELERVHSPIGLDINAETPTEIAVAILAQVINHESDDS